MKKLKSQTIKVAIIAVILAGGIFGYSSIH